MDTRYIKVDAEYIKSQIEVLRSICGQEDGDLLAGMIEGETHIDNFVGKLIDLIQTDEAHCESLKTYQKSVLDRRKRLEERSKKVRTLLACVVNELPGRVYRHPIAHLRAFDVDPRVILVDESAIPSRYWIEQDPKLNEAGIRKYLLEREALKKGVDQCDDDQERLARMNQINERFPEIPGVTLGTGELCVRIRVL